MAKHKYPTAVKSHKSRTKKYIGSHKGENGQPMGQYKGGKYPEK